MIIEIYNWHNLTVSKKQLIAFREIWLKINLLQPNQLMFEQINLLSFCYVGILRGLDSDF